MEPDFTTRNHLESVNLNSDSAIRELLNNYKFSPSAGTPAGGAHPFPTPFQSPILGSFPVAMGGAADSLVLSNMLGRLQADLERQKSPSELSGLSLNVNADILRWLILLIIVAILVWVILKVKNGSKEKRLARKVRRLEKQLGRMRKSNPTDDLDAADLDSAE